MCYVVESDNMSMIGIATPCDDIDYGGVCGTLLGERKQHWPTANRAWSEELIRIVLSMFNR